MYDVVICCGYVLLKIGGNLPPGLSREIATFEYVPYQFNCKDDDVTLLDGKTMALISVYFPNVMYVAPAVLSGLYGVK